MEEDPLAAAKAIIACLVFSIPIWAIALYLLAR